MITGLILGFIAGAVTLGLVLRNNPKIADKLGVIVDKIDNELSEQVKTNYMNTITNIAIDRTKGGDTLGLDELC